MLPVVLDVDTGVDDALALLYAVAEPRLDLRAVTCVGGNTDLPDVLANTTAVLAVAGATGVPVHAGEPHPTSGPAVEVGERWHGADGLMGLRPAAADLEGLERPAVSAEHAVEAVARLATTGGPPLVLVPLGPQTTVAELVCRHPEAVAALDRIHFMGGGGTGGNITPAAEFNVHHDPAAADTVVRSGARVVMYGLEVFEEVRVAEADVRRLESAGGRACRLAARLLRASAAKQGLAEGTLGDAGAVAALARPDLATSVRRPVAVHVGDGPARGATVVDRRAHGGPPGEGFYDVDVVERVDAAALAGHVVDVLLARYG
ncbi:nucleoside hydrolase [Aquipuribacter sp. SD81]|uniref:nucleoside hydrolase n=1 Tax=Aquipuribacter sp. SD81 TaxID=3127703 RepID=UPI0030183C2E